MGKKDRSKEIEELQEKVFGKERGSRTFYVTGDDMMREARMNEEIRKREEEMKKKSEPEMTLDPKADDLLEHARQASDDLERLKKISDERNKNLQAQLDQINSMTTLFAPGSAEVDLSKLQYEIKKDFGVDIGMDEAGKVAPKAVVTMKSFEGVKEELNVAVCGQSDMVGSLVIAFKRPYVLKNKGDKILNTILLMGPKGTGKTYALNNIAKILSRRDVLESEDVAVVDLAKYATAEDEKLFLQDVYSAIAAKGQIIEFIHADTCFPAFLTYVQDFFINGKMDLKKRYFLNQGQLVESGNSLLSSAVDAIEANNHFLVFETNLSRSKLIDLMGATFINSFADIVQTKNFDEDAVTKIVSRETADLVQKCAESFNIVLHIGNGVMEYTRDRYDKKTGAYGLKEVTDGIFDALTQLQLVSDSEITEITVEVQDGALVFAEKENVTDVASLIRKEDPVDIAEIKKELDDIVGLTKVKEYVLSLKDNYDVQQMREKQGLKNVGVSRHMIFLGNPGTGKTTIARIISRYLRALGVLSGGQLVEVTRADLVGQYVGHTAPLTMKVLRSAVGGVLFIDEAYSLYRGKDDVFGLECIDTLVKGIEDYRDDLIVILAGYEKEMEVFLSANTGLKSRFPNIINFPDYTPEELVAIAHSIAKSKDYVILEECNEPLLAYFTAMQDDHQHVSGNGRTVRNKVEEAILRQSRRTLKDPTAKLNELTKDDFNLSDSSFVE